jgi:hypothetical protein
MIGETEEVEYTGGGIAENGRNSMKMMRYRLLLLTVLLNMLASLSCQSPTETPPSTLRTVTVLVQNADGTGVESVPVSMYALPEAETGSDPVNSALTDRNGSVRFAVDIPASGKGFRILAGDDRLGRVAVDANLLCRDTMIVIRLLFEDVPCGGDVSHTLRITNICAPLKTGERYSDSAEVRFISGCDVPLTFTFAGDASGADMQFRLLDASGRQIPGFPFTIPARGQFTFRAVASPLDSGLKRWNVVLNGSGPNQATATVRVTVEVDAANCNICECQDTVIVVDFGVVQARPTSQRGTRSVELPANLCNFIRFDNLIKGAFLPTIFGVSPIGNVQLGPGDASRLQLSFVPPDTLRYSDTLFVEHFIPAEQKRCTTMVILRGQGCGPACRIIPDNLQQTGADRYNLSMDRVRAYQSGVEQVCFENPGLCGSVTLNLSAADGPGFSVTPRTLTIDPGESGCFTVRFDAEDGVVWPQGHGRPADIDHDLRLEISNCGAMKTVDVRVVVDTMPAQFSRCIYQWDQNENFGYNFTPIEGKGEDRFDPQAIVQQISDLVVLSVRPGVDADVLLRSGWKFIKSGVSEAQFNFTDMSAGLNGWTRSEYESITSGSFNTGRSAVLAFRGVYSVRIERGGVVYFACVRVRELSVDPDGKFKLCLDVLFPMIQE